MALTHLQVGPYKVIGRSLGGFYESSRTRAQILFDVGAAFRAGSTARNLFLSHGHADHIGALPALLGMRGLMGVKTPIRIFAPAKVVAKLPAFLSSFSELHHWPMHVDLVPLEVGDVVKVQNDLWVKAIQTFHPVPSLRYVISRRVKKLKQEFRSLPGAEIKRLKADQEQRLFDTVDKPEFAYVTDTLPEVLNHHPELARCAGPGVGVHVFRRTQECQACAGWLPYTPRRAASTSFRASRTRRFYSCISVSFTTRARYVEYFRRTWRLETANGSNLCCASGSWVGVSRATVRLP